MSNYETNANKLPWMQDPHGFVSNLRREGCRSIGRMQGDDQKMEILMDTLRVLAKYASAKMVEQQIERETRILQRAAATAKATSRNLNDAMEIERQLQAQIASVKVRLTSVQTRRAQAEAQQAIIHAGGAERAALVREEQQTADGIGGEKS